MKKTVKKNIDLNKKYAFPKNIVVVHHKDKILVISIDTANWIVLDNEIQLKFFNLLRSNTLGKAIELFDEDKNEAINVIIQLEAKSFENQIVKKTPIDSIFIYITNACNMRCPHCYMYADCKKENELTLEEINLFLANFKKTGGRKITFSGGEVCMRRDFSDIINDTYELGYKIEILTNGTLWTEKMINELSTKISEVQISVDGYCEEENSRICGEGNFKKALDTADKFINNNVATRIAITPFFDAYLEQKIVEYSKFSKNLIKKYNGKDFKVIFTKDLIDGREIKNSEMEKKKYAEIIGEIYKNVYETTEDSSFIERHRNHNILNNCSFGNMYISSTGDVYPCSRVFDIKPFANIRENSFSEILELSEMERKLSDINNLIPCKDCELKYICGGGCRLTYFLKNQNVRNCSTSNKEYFYDLMIKVNRDLFQ